MKNLRYAILPAFFAILALAGLLGATGEQGSPYANMIYRHEGNVRDWFNISCVNNAWTVVVSSEPTSRSVIFIGIQGNTDGVCLSSSTASGACDDSREGPHVYPGSALTDYGTYSWYCRSRSGNTDRITGYRSRHSSDNSSR